MIAVLTATLRSLKFEHAIIKWALRAKFDKKTLKYFRITFLKAVVDHSFKSLAFLGP